MKTILALATALAVAPAFAQQGGSALDSASGSKHMFEFSPNTLIGLGGLLSFDKAKTPGQKADHDTKLDLELNYAYALPAMPRLQVGGRLAYLADTGDAGDVENWGWRVGAIMNHTTDLKSAAYASLFLGMDWNREYGSDVRDGNYDDEVRNVTLAIGKRFNLERFGLNHLTYSPEIALSNKNSTTGGDFEYEQALELRFLQFALFF